MRNPHFGWIVYVGYRSKTCIIQKMSTCQIDIFDLLVWLSRNENQTGDALLQNEGILKMIINLAVGVPAQDFRQFYAFYGGLILD